MGHLTFFTVVHNFQLKIFVYTSWYKCAFVQPCIIVFENLYDLLSGYGAQVVNAQTTVITGQPGIKLKISIYI